MYVFYLSYILNNITVDYIMLPYTKAYNMLYYTVLYYTALHNIFFYHNIELYNISLHHIISLKISKITNRL